MSKTSTKAKPDRHKTGIPDPGNRCTHTDALGRQCRSLALKAIKGDAPGLAPGFCATHATADRQLREADAVAEYLFKGAPKLNTASAVNHVLNNLFVLIGNNCIPPRNARLLVYLGALLLNSVSGVEHEMIRARGYKALDDTFANAFGIIDHNLQTRSGEVSDNHSDSGDDADSSDDADSESAANPSADSEEVTANS
jgi:hypothetical protein